MNVNADNVTADTLNNLMEIGHVIQVHPDGQVTEPRGVWAPDLHAVSDADGQHTADTDPGLHRQAESAGWSLETGHTGQHGYRGPCMHSAEYIGGRLAEYILTTPGYWVAVEVTEDDGNAESWALAFREAE